jgi:hypothetical protein
MGVDESDILNKFILYHMEFMNKWIDLYDKKREELLEAMRQFKISNTRNTPLPIDLLGKWGKDCTLEWVVEKIQNQIEDASIDSNITKYEINMCRGCERKIQLEFYKMFFPYNFDTMNYFNIRHYMFFHRNKWSLIGEEIYCNVDIWMTLSCRKCICKESIF